MGSFLQLRLYPVNEQGEEKWAHGAALLDPLRNRHRGAQAISRLDRRLNLMVEGLYLSQQVVG